MKRPSLERMSGQMRYLAQRQFFRKVWSESRSRRLTPHWTARCQVTPTRAPPTAKKKWRATLAALSLEKRSQRASNNPCKRA
jgi:hypothetical protein